MLTLDIWFLVALSLAILFLGMVLGIALVRSLRT